METPSNEFHHPFGNLLFSTALLAAGAGVLLYATLTEGSLSFIGIDFSASGFMRVLAAALGLACVIGLLGVVSVMIGHRPWLKMTDNEFIVRPLLLRRRVSWDRIANISDPQTTTLGFGSKLAAITVTLHSGKRVRLLPPTEQAAAVHTALAHHWRGVN